MSNKNESVNPMNSLRDFLTQTIEGLEQRGKTPTNLIKALDLFNVVKDANNARIKGVRELRDFVKAAVKESEDKGKPSKNLQSLLELVKDVASVNHGRIAELTEQITTALAANEALLARAEALEDALKSEPAKNVLRLVRNAAILNEEQSTQHEEVSVTADPEAVLSRIVPVVSPYAGVIGFAVLFSHNVKQLFYFQRFAAELEVARGAALDLDNNKSDGLLVYQVTLNSAITLADKYAQLLGPLTHLVSDSSSMSEAFETEGDTLGTSLEVSDEENGDADDDVVSTDGDDDDDVEVSVGEASADVIVVSGSEDSDDDPEDIESDD
jgi:hypothetical protein